MVRSAWKLGRCLWLRAALPCVGLLVAGVAAPAGALGEAFGAGEAEASPQLRGFVSTQDRTIRPGRSVPTRIFCPGGRFIPFTWGFRPISAPQDGVAVDAVVTSVVPHANRRGVFAWTVTLFNPNPGATVEMRVSATCVQGRRGVETVVDRSGEVLRDSSGGVSASPGGAADARAVGRQSRRKPTLSADAQRIDIGIPAGRRVSGEVFCDRRRNSAVADIGFDSDHSELIGVDFVERDGVPGAQVTLQNRAGADDEGAAYVVCLEGKRFRVKESEVVASASASARGGGGTATTSGATAAGEKPGLEIVRSRFTSDEIMPGERPELLALCDGPRPAPEVAALPAGSGGRLGDESGPANDTFLLKRDAFFLGGEEVRNPIAAALLEFLHGGDDPEPAFKEPTCAAGLGDVRTLVHPESELEDFSG